MFVYGLSIFGFETHWSHLNKNVSQRLQFIDKAKFITSSLSNLFEWIHEIRHQYGSDDKKQETLRIENKTATAFFNTKVL